MNFDDDYLERIIAKGHEGSAFLAAQFASTLNNNVHIFPLSKGMHGVVVAQLPELSDVVVHVAGGNPFEDDLETYGASLVENLASQAHTIGAIPIGFVDVVDARAADIETILRPLAAGMKSAADHHGVAVMNGELAVLGDRVRDANLTGVMISLLPLKKWNPLLPVPIVRSKDNVSFVQFSHNRKAIYMNADGVGTKTEFYERAGWFDRAVFDFLAMNLDDASKLAANAMVAAGLIETRGRFPAGRIVMENAKYAAAAGVTGLFSQESVGDRLQGYDALAPTYNLSGGVVSLIDEQRLANKPKPSEGDYLVAIRGKPNPRSNGISDKRRIMREWLGPHWHTTPTGRHYLEFLAEPSTVFYPVFKDLLDTGLASCVYHMSGGAYKGKLGEPIAKEGLHVAISGLFDPDPREASLAAKAGFTDEVAYAKWPMGNEGFISSPDPEAAIVYLAAHNLEARVVGQFERHAEKKGVTIRTPAGTVLQYAA